MKIFKILLGLSLFVILFACTKEDENIQMESSKDLQFQTKSIRDGVGILFTYSTKQEEVSKTKLAFEKLTTETDSIITASNGNITHVFAKVTIGGGIGQIERLYYVNEPRNLVVNELVFNPQTGYLDSVGGGGNVYEPTNGEPVPTFGQLAGVCPNGGVYLGGCTNSGDNLAYGNCITNLVISLSTQAGSGETTTVQTIQTSNYTYACGNITAQTGSN